MGARQRLEYWTAPVKQLHGNLHLPEQHKHVDILELRKVRLAENAAAARCLGAHPALHQQAVLAGMRARAPSRIACRVLVLQSWMRLQSPVPRTLVALVAIPPSLPCLAWAPRCGLMQQAVEADAHRRACLCMMRADEMGTLLERVNTVGVLGPMLMDFCDKHARRVSRQRCCYLRRVANLCQSSASLEAVAPLLQARLASTDGEYALVTESKEAMSHSLPIAIKDEENREKEQRMAQGQGPAKAPETKRAGGKDAGPKPGAVLPGRTAAEANVALAAPMPRKMMKLFLRWTTAHVRLQKRMARFLAKVQWLVYTQRYELLRRAKAIVVNPSLSPGATSAATNLSMGGAHGAAAAGKIPTMVTSMDKLNTMLTTLKSHFNIEEEMQADQALAFADEVKTLVNKLHAIQTADTTYPPYDTTLVGATITVPGAGAAGSKRGAASDAKPAATPGKGARGGGASAGADSKAVLDTSFLKPCAWLAEQTLQAETDVLVTRQRGVLSAIKDAEVRHVQRGRHRAYATGGGLCVF